MEKITIANRRRCTLNDKRRAILHTMSTSSLINSPLLLCVMPIHIPASVRSSYIRFKVICEWKPSYSRRWIQISLTIQRIRIERCRTKWLTTPKDNAGGGKCEWKLCARTTVVVPANGKSCVIWRKTFFSSCKNHYDGCDAAKTTWLQMKCIIEIGGAIRGDVVNV